MNHSVLERSIIHNTDQLSKDARCIWLPVDPIDLSFRSPGTNLDTSYLALLLTGCEPGTNVGYAEVSYNLEYIPKYEYFGTVIRQLVPSDTA